MINTKESRAGAMACIEAIKAIRRITANPSSNITNEQYFKKCDNSQQAAINCSEPDLSPFMVGFISAVGEYLFINQDGIPDPDLWVPFAAMTHAQAEKKRKIFFEEFTDDE
jgi:hypothetical protein